jgi:hypothetical protein
MIKRGWYSIAIAARHGIYPQKIRDVDAGGSERCSPFGGRRGEALPLRRGKFKDVWGASIFIYGSVNGHAALRIIRSPAGRIKLVPLSVG